MSNTHSSRTSSIFHFSAMVVLPINSTHRMNCCYELVIVAEKTKLKKTRCALHRILNKFVATVSSFIPMAAHFECLEIAIVVV